MVKLSKGLKLTKESLTKLKESEIRNLRGGKAAINRRSSCRLHSCGGCIVLTTRTKKAL